MEKLKYPRKRTIEVPAKYRSLAKAAADFAVERKRGPKANVKWVEYTSVDAWNKVHRSIRITFYSYDPIDVLAREFCYKMMENDKVKGYCWVENHMFEFYNSWERESNGIHKC